MITRYDFGHPYDTGAVVRSLAPAPGDPVPFKAGKDESGLTFTLPLEPDDRIFGLGQSVRGLNKRGFRYVSWNADEPVLHENRKSLYGSHNFLVFTGKKGTFAAYFDDPGELTLDLGFTSLNEAKITSANGDLTLYILEGGSAVELVREFRGLIGRSWLPPRWAFGFIQSRWGYCSEDEIRAVVRNHRDRHIPIDGVCMDIDYMDHYRDFTWNTEAFPDLATFSADMKADHIRLIPTIDAGIKASDADPVCVEGREKGYFCKKEDGSEFVGAVWPGRAVFPDFFRPEVRSWFAGHYRPLLEAGIEGFWNDMNEPAIFYSDETLKEAFDKVDELREIELDIDTVFKLKDAVVGISNNMDDYRRFVHTLPTGETVRHDKVHNLYGAYMTKASCEALRTFDPSRRRLLFCRSSFIGAHRDGGIWQGDNASRWSDILLNLRMMPSLNMCGFMYTGADLGGFVEDTSGDLLLRWLQLGAFTPLMRDHSATGTRNQETYRFENWEDMKHVLEVRYALIPWLYSEFMQAALSGDCLYRPLAFDYPEDPEACDVEDQVMVGSGCMIAPVYQSNAKGRYVYLPEDMLMIRFRSGEDYDLIPMTKGHHHIGLALNEFPLFIRKNHFIPLAAPAEATELLDDTKLKLIGLLDKDSALTYYRDNGYDPDPVLADHTQPIRVTLKNDTFSAESEGLTLDCSGLIRG